MNITLLITSVILSSTAFAQLGMPENLTTVQQERLQRVYNNGQWAKNQQLRMQEAEAVTPEQHMQLARVAIIQQRDELRKMEIILGQINSPYTANRQASNIQALSSAYMQAKHLEQRQLLKLPLNNKDEMQRMQAEQVNPLLQRVQRQVEILAQDERYYGSEILHNATYFLLR